MDNRRARGALERAFAQLIRRGGKSFVMQVSEREALGFPGQQPHVANTVYALAVGLDAAGCGAYAIQGMGYVEHRKMPARIKRMADAEAARMAGAKARVELLEILDVDGLPQTG
ncbi:hypothetical protein [Paracoccus alcaliphilus]|uniref:hypothetical protein n=1 Tax=Paracoccus alcaliphilus TaxID=34002 RepID=UPI00147FA256|nr:hypothetical protein [Paracoccus alcaliphilus]WCR17995.1 hypothetical protein JHW40_17145 [Paracoccus alcaliphilus]